MTTVTLTGGLTVTTDEPAREFVDRCKINMGTPSVIQVSTVRGYLYLYVDQIVLVEGGDE